MKHFRVAGSLALLSAALIASEFILANAIVSRPAVGSAWQPGSSVTFAATRDVISAGPAEDFERLVRSEISKWKKVADVANIRTD